MKANQLKQYDEVQNQIIEELLSDPRYEAFFLQYRDSSIPHFAKAYAHHKANLLVYGDFTKFQQRYLWDIWQDSAWYCLREIQQKKLFDLCCRWQAGQVTDLPEIEITHDFVTVGGHVLDYSVLSDISEVDLDQYLDYYQSDEIDHREVYEMDYQQYQDIQEHYMEEGETGIAYFDFHNTHTGNYTLLQQPPLRLEKELFYIKKSMESIHADHEEKMKNTPPEKPYLSSCDEELIKFAERFKDRKTSRFITDYSQWLKENPDLEIKYALDYLKWTSPEKVSIRAHDDWQESVLDAVDRHKRQKVIEILPTIYEEYLMKKQIGIRLTPESRKKEYNSAKWMKDLILKGRKLQGEPENFDF
ncbi:hypothetical protein [Reichenbachiella sp. MSK19-1]|uniref:hypothetical protein n=1 Tax=Reichenbachiella sp. MSK19-1 TaxID=1897631 RepID=UPI0011C43EDD|nr:hypothetical protein [Reichenbachiella sp. MSK19-1]